MMDRCVINNCCSSVVDRELFMFPFKDQILLAKWLKEIPKSLYMIIPNPSFLCEDHFEKSLVKESYGVKTLLPSAVPTIFTSRTSNLKSSKLDNSCRFCLKTMADMDVKQTITHNVRSQFFSITQRTLSSSGVFSQSICDACFSSVQNVFTFRSKLIAHQEYLENALNEESEETVDSIKQVEEVIKVELEDKVANGDEKVDSYQIFYEEYLEPDLVSDLVDANIEKCGSDNVKSSDEVRKKKSERKKLCSDCGKTYAIHAYKRHYERVHLRLKNYHCDFCPYKSYSRSHIEIHLKSHLKIKTYYCEQCGSAFGSATILKQHYLTHQDDRPYSCEHLDCGLSFKSVYALRRHQKTHSDDKWRFQCDECSAKFTDKWHLTRHQKSHRSQSHPCENCGKVFGTEDRLKAHQIYHRPPQFHCELCNKEFYKKPDLLTHIKTHSGLKDYHCEFCPNSYFKKAHLQRHMKIHQIHSTHETS